MSLGRYANAEALANLLIVAHESERAAEKERDKAMAALSEDDLNDLEIRAAVRAIQEQPELAVLAAAELGWTVIPPDETTDQQEDADG